MGAGGSVGIFQYAGPATFSYFDVGGRWDEPLRLRPEPIAIYIYPARPARALRGGGSSLSWTSGVTAQRLWRSGAGRGRPE